MDAHQFFGYSVTTADLSYSSYPTSVPTRLFGSFTFGSTNSPNSPFSSHFDSETLASLSDSQEQHSSTENVLGGSPSSNCSLDYDNHFQQLSPSLDCLHDSVHCRSSEIPFLQNENRNQKIKHALLEVETALMGPDDEEAATPMRGYRLSQTSGQRTRSWSQEAQCSHLIPSQSSHVSVFGESNDGFHNGQHKVMDNSPVSGIFPNGNLKQLLIACARAVAENKIDEFEFLVEKARSAVSVSGDPLQRLGAYMIEGLVARKVSSGNKIYQSLRCREPAGPELMSYMHIMYEICPYLKFGYMAANGAIAEACRNETHIHIVDFQIVQGIQWVTLLQALAARPSGAPHVRITGIDDPVSKYARGDGLAAVGRRLAAISEKFHIPVEFHAVPVFAPDVTMDMLDIRPGEALAVNFALQLHHTPDESVDVNNPRDELLRKVKSLNPKVVTLVEQESNTNTAPFFPRFLEILDYYSAVFESIDVTMPRDRKERINVEEHCLAREIVNIIACEDKERVERHELLGKWKSRFTMAGFKQYPLSSYVNSVIRGLLKCYSDNYRLEERDGAMLLGWNQRNLISASAWH